MIILTDFPQNFIKSNTGRRSQESPSQESGGRRREEGGRRKKEVRKSGSQEVRKSGSQEVRKAYYIIVFYLHRFHTPIGNFV
ncbi:hypothetical protein FJR06_16140 [Dolichospermum sp. UHCC 0352]|uniref:hypothetical protein n=1 Tax=Dolichospermum sp. UHCC 0352 TaxID=2590011 RepID=UPI0014486BDF|nr:hypothetical protein [Dolichospermum sp. UHCC 0352]MTJ22764.1 hypothetical protein [Dolichospermum sp. UHCC 0352]